MQFRSLLALVLVTACGSSSPARTPVAAAAPPVAVAAPPGAPDPSPPAALVPPAARLPATVRPIRYRASLQVDPAAAELKGELAIEVEITEPTALIWLHADELSIDAATVERGAEVQTLTASPQPGTLLALRATAPLAVGKARLVLRYRARLRHGEHGGATVYEDHEQRYVATLFEPDDARRVFPSFDEPGFKVPWQLTLKVPAGQRAFSNAAETATRREGDWDVVDFAETAPLPTYLVAFAVGPFEIVDAGRSRSGMLQRLIVPRGRGADAAYAVEVVGGILALLEDYTGIPYPYPKLDHLAHPGPGGAMEHVGLITYGETVLLIPAAEQSVKREQKLVNFVAHEVAHQWFGDLVTPAWWDDVWLNESFASWAEQMVTARFRPAWGVSEERAWRRDSALRADALASARKIRQPVLGPDDMTSAFDSITYLKGSVVLSMIERWAGIEAFRHGVQTHLQRRAHGVATYRDFATALTESASADAGAVLDSFVDQAGAPRLDVVLRCDAGAPALTLTQSRYAPLGAHAQGEARWAIPVCARWGLGKKTGRTCALVRDATTTLALTGAAGCPDWVMADEDGFGYYRMTSHGTLLTQLVRHLDALRGPERIALASDVLAQVAAGEAPVDVALDLVTALAARSDRASLESASWIIRSIDDAVAPSDRARWQAWVSKRVDRHVRALGLSAGKKDSLDQALLRPKLLRVAALSGGDARVIAEARALTARWLDDDKAVEGELLDAVLSIAAENGDRALWERLASEARSTTSMRRRARLLGMLGRFRDPALLDASLALVLDPKLPADAAIQVAYWAANHRDSAAQAYRYLAAHWDAIVARLPAKYGADLVEIGAATCDPALRDEVGAYFRPRSAVRYGGPRAYEQAMEEMDICIAWNKANGAALAAYLRR